MLAEDNSQSQLGTLSSSLGLYDINVKTEDTHKEIAKCLDMSREGIHAMLMVFSAATRFTPEDADTIKSITMFFGDKIVDHMILVFTYGDQVGEMTWRKMLTDKNARYLQVCSLSWCYI
jgi:hypothetical protein